MLISIIIPTYNRAHLISETLDSILAQTYSNWECIVVDDGSTDNTIEVISEYIKKDSGFQYHQRPDNRKKGPNSCRNYGFELSKGECIQWFDSDDVMLPYLLEKQVLSFAKNVEMSVCKLSYFDFEKKISIRENIIFSNNLIADYLIGKVTFYISGPLWKRSFLEKQNQLFDESLMNLDDWDFNLRMLYQKPNIRYVNEVLILYRVHADSLSQEIGKGNFEEVQSEFEARRKHLKLLKINKLANPRILKHYIKGRCKFIFREAMIKKDKNKYYYLKMLVVSQLELLDFRGFFKTIFGFTVFSIFNKGYKLLK
jgi:glycosyltransferase involved in cell wall biosynthesis